VAQCTTGCVCGGQEKDEAALAAYGNIPEADTMHYAMGQFNSAVLLHMHGNFRAALGVYQNVPESVPDQYARAQLNLGVLYQQMGLDDKEHS